MAGGGGVGWFGARVVVVDDHRRAESVRPHLRTHAISQRSPRESRGGCLHAYVDVAHVPLMRDA